MRVTRKKLFGVRPSATVTIIALSAALAGCATLGDAPQLACADAGPTPTRISTRGAELAPLSGLQPAALRSTAPARDPGFVTLSCKPRDGRLAGCKLLSETPADRGFAKVALAQAPKVVYPLADAPERIEVTFRYEPVENETPPRCS